MGVDRETDVTQYTTYLHAQTYHIKGSLTGAHTSANCPMIKTMIASVFAAYFSKFHGQFAKFHSSPWCPVY